MSKVIKTHVKLNVKQLYEFTLYNTYRGLFGIISVITIVLSLALLITGINQEGTIKKILIFVILIIFAGVIPYLMYKQAEVYLKNSPIYKDGLLYEIDDNEIRVHNDDQIISSPWKKVYNAIETKNSFYLYTQNLGAIILPKNYVDEDYELIKKYIIRNVKGAHKKLKKK